MKRNISESVLLAYFNGELSPEEERAVRDWAQSHERNRQLFDKIGKEHFRLRWGVRASMIVGYDKIYQPVPQRSLRRTWLRAAAVLVPVLAISSFFLLYRNASDTGGQLPNAEPTSNQVILELSDGTQHRLGTAAETSLVERDGTDIAIKDGEIVYGSDQTPEGALVYNKVTVPRGVGPYKMFLADGTMVVLNSETIFRFPVHFSGSVREVFLQGEAYFQVSHIADRPFAVHSDQASVEVLGTQFNYTAYPDEANTLITLIEGSVRVGTEGGKKILVPGEQFQLDNTSGKKRVAQVDTYLHTSWTTGVMRYEKMTLEMLMPKLSKWFDISYDFGHDDLKKLRFTGGFRKDSNILQLLEVLNESNQAQFEYKNNEILIRKK